MSTSTYNPSPAYHFMNHPTTPGLYMFMLCYKNGSLAREQIRDRINASSSTPMKENDWSLFNEAITSSAPLSAPTPNDPRHLGLYFPRHEIVPALPPGEWRFTLPPASSSSTTSSSSSATQPPHLTNVPSFPTLAHDARTIVESQLLSIRLRSANLVSSQPPPTSTSTSTSTSASTPTSSTKQAPLPPQPRKTYLAGGASVNPAIASLAGAVLGSAEGVHRLSLGENACALGASYKAVWALERARVRVQRGAKAEEDGGFEGFEESVGKRWKEEEFAKEVDQGYRRGVWEGYGEVIGAFGEMEGVVGRMVEGES